MMARLNDDDLPNWNIQPRIRLEPVPDAQPEKKFEDLWKLRKRQLIKHRFQLK